MRKPFSNTRREWLSSFQTELSKLLDRFDVEILFVGHGFHPVNILALRVIARDRHLHHTLIGRGAMEMLDSLGANDHVSLFEYAHLLPVYARATFALGNDEHLSGGMRVPKGTAPGSKIT